MAKASEATTEKEVRSWCRERFGKDWWNVDKAIKRERKANARRALANKSPDLPEAAMAPKPGPEPKPPRQPNPFKRTYLLKMRWSYSNEETVERITPLDPATCIGKGATFQETGPREKGGAGGALYLLCTSWFLTNYEDSEVEEEENEHVYFGEHPLPGCGGSVQIRDFAKKGDTSDVLGQKLVRYKLDCPLVIDHGLWVQMTPATQEAILRDSSAWSVFLCAAQF